ncbi:cysteine desulfurase family protein [Demequina zhanjiangensis]|uniref:Cysteine desulfurase family protein n=1 Tax=Demequina zhanjiangensis TaxID=3051659 RepID=A0ABT8FY29_9MICO|nr:cysteine desulfurase family protein [Demequina sp. SYSU T00b26]MDN4471805.1 cysteine desulfurase family protein [Demequina sp. SYSU T00b26]
MHYLDHAATSPLRPAARAAWLEAADAVGNPSSLHGDGRRRRAIVEEARERIAAALGADPAEVILLSGGTEADNLGVKGLWWGRGGGRIVTTAVEHHAVLDPARWLAQTADATVHESPVSPNGSVDVDAFRTALPGAALASAMWVNNEVGAIQPIAELAAAAKEAGVPMHCDAVQAVGHLEVDFHESGLTTMAVSAHKLGGPVGVGALIARRDAPLSPLLHGGGQERKVRSGTVDAAGAAAFASALEEAVRTRQGEAARIAALAARLADGIRAAIPDAVVRGARDGYAPHIVHAVVPGASSEAMLMLMDASGVAVSSGSACTAGVVERSHVLQAMGHSAEESRSAVRFSLGWSSTDADVDAALAALPDAVSRARAAGQ